MPSQAPSPTPLSPYAAMFRWHTFRQVQRSTSHGRASPCRVRPAASEMARYQGAVVLDMDHGAAQEGELGRPPREAPRSLGAATDRRAVFSGHAACNAGTDGPCVSPILSHQVEGGMTFSIENKFHSTTSATRPTAPRGGQNAAEHDAHELNHHIRTCQMSSDACPRPRIQAPPASAASIPRF
jgi:hypothetical protein